MRLPEIFGANWNWSGAHVPTHSFYNTLHMFVQLFKAPRSLPGRGLMSRTKIVVVITFYRGIYARASGMHMSTDFFTLIIGFLMWSRQSRTRYGGQARQASYATSRLFCSRSASHGRNHYTWGIENVADTSLISSGLDFFIIQSPYVIVPHCFGWFA